MEEKVNKRRIMIIAGLLFFALIARFGVNEVHAAMNLDGIFYQNLINWVPYCYSQALVDNITINEYNSGTNGKKLEKLFLPDWKPSDTPKPQNGSLTFYIPSLDIGNNKISAESSHDHGRAINCYAAFGGDGNTLGDIGSLPGRMVSLLEKYNVDMNNAQETLERMGYEIDSGTIARSTEGYCYTIYVEYNTAQPINVGSMCKNDEDYDLGTDSTLVFSGGSNRNYIVSAGVYGRFLGGEKRLAISVKNTAVTYADISSVAYFGLGKPTVGSYRLQGQIPGYVEVTRSSNVGFASDNQRLKKSNNSDVVVNKISNGTASIKDFTSADMYNLYIEYLKKNYGFTGVGSECVEQKPSILVDTNAHEYYIWSSGQWCLAGLNPNLVDKRADMTVFWGGDKKKLSHVVHTLPDLINLMGDLDYNDGDFDSVATIMEEDEYSGEKKATCKNSTGAKSLGWIVCPILDLVSSAVDGIYTNYVEPNLQLSPRLFGNVQENGGGEQFDGTYEAWVTFRDFANVVFIVLLLIVIFSQLTGIGIDNYGIKKILPKLIVAAILINLSYILCMILVDISNIVGSGVQSILNGLGKDISGMSFGISGEGNGVGDSNYTLQGSAVTGVAILAAIGTVGAILANPAILLSLFVSAIGIFVAIFFLFVLLAAREATIIVLVILSPLAFVCYMLPNTKKMFDRWWKLFEGLLLVYPIAGLMVGGGNYVSKLLMATGFADENQGGSFVTAFTAMMVGIIPIFFIPMVLKSSFAAMGKVGGMLTGLGAKAQGVSTKAIRESERYRGLQQRGLERRTRLRAGIDSDGNALRLSRLGVAMRGGRRRVAAARASYDKTQAERVREGLWMDPQYSASRAQYRSTATSNEKEKMYSDLFDRNERGANVDILSTSLRGNDAEQASAALSTLIKQGGIKEALDTLSSDSLDWSTMDVGVKNRLMQTMSSSGVDAMKSYSKYVQTGGGAGFNDWVRGSISDTQKAADRTAGAKDTSYAQHLLDGGEKAMAGYSKDEMQFITQNGNADAIRKSMENQVGEQAGKNMFGSMLMNTAIDSSDAKTKTEAEKLLTEQISNGKLDISQLGITGDSISNMRGETAQAIEKGYVELWKRSQPGISENDARNGARNHVRASVSTQINTLKSDTQALNKTNNTTREIFGV